MPLEDARASWIAASIQAPKEADSLKEMENRLAATSRAREHVIRNGEEMFVLAECLTPEERAEVAERRASKAARRRFAAQLAAITRREKRLLAEALEAWSHDGESRTGCQKEGR
jgi:hypothetical protein